MSGYGFGSQYSHSEAGSSAYTPRSLPDNDSYSEASSSISWGLRSNRSESSSGGSSNYTHSNSSGTPYDAFRMPEEYSVSPPPSTHTALSSFTRELTLQPTGAQSQPRPHMLRCEFLPWTGCEEAFHLNEVDLWIRHIEDDHLQRNYPSLCICWYCDDFQYNTQEHHFGPGKNFEYRMQHIADHMLDGYRFERRRPDFHFLDHVYQLGLISTEAFQLATGSSEGPAAPAGLVLQRSASRVERPRRLEAVVEVAESSGRPRRRQDRRHY
ncbi:hypothetical protein CkaCkLH20_04930 [Colletotrichum karsti]|uniref:Uncharacterized protein n=1 Tax=Colletotrichum karsti TaxID=1095194 RepID=A0A9P6IFL5_9PEZI|nr:uncharacterized protein CkaCkLH20_04930 [Colletotrichum karsti]KAF9877795.1 hypothetical protein CkaCkLH20_04930 [Colletotrichum karsti]